MKRCMLLVALILALVLPSVASATDIPAVVGYHSLVLDEGGNPIPDGDWGVRFRITDVSGNPLYEERQNLPAIGGRLSALIGNGLDANGAPTGGLSPAMLDPSGAKYLEVEIEGMDPLPAVELASVPYASYAQTALGVADASVGFEGLSGDVMVRIADELTGGAGADAIILREELGSLYSDPSSATSIGVSTAGFTSSSSSDLQGALADIDLSLSAHSGDIAGLATSLSSESAARAGADSAEASARSTADATEATVRAEADYALDTRLDAIEDPSRLSFARSAWGSVAGGSSPTIIGQNASIAWEGANTYRVNFSQPFSSAGYAVILTPIGGVHSADMPSVYDKSASGFRVGFSISAATQSFDFMVLSN